MHVNYSFVKFLGTGSFNVAAILEVGLHCWQSACIPRSVQGFNVLSEEKGCNGEVP